jgi:hypothetical protein
VIYEDLYEISKLLLAEDDAERTPEVLLRRIVERCGAEAGFVVVLEDGFYQQKFEVGEERGRCSELERRFSRTLSSRRPAGPPPHPGVRRYAAGGRSFTVSVRDRRGTGPAGRDERIAVSRRKWYHDESWRCEDESS